MPYIKLLTVLAGLALLTACGGGTAETPDTAGGNATDCKTNAFHADCSADAPAIKLRQDMCLADDSADSTCGVVITGACEANPFRTETACGHTDYDDDRETACLADTTKHSTCVGDTGIATVFCEADPFNTATACGHADYADERQTMCLADIMIDDSCRGEMGIATVFCEANPFDTATPCMHGDYADERQTMCLANIMIDDSCRGDMGIATLFCEANPFDTATPCMHGDYADERQTMCLANIMIDDSCRGTTGIATLFCEANPFDTATPCGHADYADERQTMCLANIAIDDSCRGDMGIATVFCKANWFDTSNACTADTYLPLRVADCITAGNAGDMKCDTIFTASASNDCLTNPFTDACTTDGAFGTYAEMARAKRETFCESDSGELCTPLTTCRATPFGTGCGDYFAPEKIGECITAGNADETRCNNLFTASASNNCLTNPFTDACKTDSDFGTYADMARTNRLTFCKTSTTDAFCTTTNLANVCGFDPFHPICFADGTYDTPRATTITTCSARAKVDDPACTSTLTRPNAATFLQSFTTALSTTPATTNTPRHGFLQGGTNTVDFGTLRANGGVDPTVRTLNLGTLGGDAEDGIAYFAATIGGSSGGYAGIFSGTDLGAPLPAYDVSTEPIARWNGKFGAEGTGTIRNQDFILNVNFETRKIDAFVQFVTILHYKLDGDFNDRGLIVNGTVVFGEFTGNVKTALVESTQKLGILTGLIGQEGAVGVFHSDDNAAGTREYAGGFVAAPILSIPNYDTFVRHYEPQKNADNTKLLESGIAAGRLNQFLKGQETGITFPLSVEVALDYTATGHFETVALKLEGDSANGIGLMRAFVSVDQINELHRSGILLGTDLGAPLTGNEMDANWSGKLYVTRHVNASDENKPIAIDLELAVDFSAGTIRTANAVTTAPNETVAINGTFGAGDVTLPAGIMGGTVSYHDGTTTYHALPLIGLIGDVGAIGVFHGGEGVLLPMAGGFIVKP